MTKHFVGLDVGEKRIGVAVADSQVRIAVPYQTIEVNGNEVAAIQKLVAYEKADVLVVGYPRNQIGLATVQTRFTEAFVDKLGDIDATIVFQDESLTSVTAEERLRSRGKPYHKADIDAEAASIILQDYIELNHG